MSKLYANCCFQPKRINFYLYHQSLSMRLSVVISFVYFDRFSFEKSKCVIFNTLLSEYFFGWNTSIFPPFSAIAITLQLLLITHIHLHSRLRGVGFCFTWPSARPRTRAILNDNSWRCIGAVCNLPALSSNAILFLERRCKRVCITYD